MAASEPTETLTHVPAGGIQKPISVTLQDVPYPVWKAVKDRASTDRVSAKSIWIAAVEKMLELQSSQA